MATTIDIASMAKNREVRKINGQYVEVFPETKAQYVTVDDWQGSAAKLSDVLSSLTNVVHTSGDEIIGGVKTFSDGIVVAGTQSLASIKSTSDAGLVRLGGGTDGKTTTGAVCMLGGINNTTYPGRFLLFASNGSSYKALSGKPDGTLTWDGKDIITNGGDQTIAGTKTFTSNVYSAQSWHTGYICKSKSYTYDSANPATPNSSVYGGVWLHDSAGTSLGFYDIQFSSSGNMFCEMSIKPPVSGGSALEVRLYHNKANTIKSFRPETTNLITLGNSGNVWKQLFAGTTTISTSDERLKDNITVVPDAVLDAWGDVQWSQFQFKDSIEEKGVNKARLHSGLVAQRIDTVFKAHGLDASRYGLFCYDRWEAEPEDRNEQGEVVTPAKEAGDAYALRYEEALCMEAAYQRRRADHAEARIAALEQRLDEMETVIATLGFSGGDQE